MENPSARLLRLLTLLQARSRWTGPELCDRLGVSPRTLRYDMAKLRDLGYRVQAEPGVAGGYRLRPGDTLPPLHLTDDEAVAMAIGLRAASGVAGLGESAATALAKLEQLLPRRLRGRVTTLVAFTAAVGQAGPAIDPDLVVFLTGACRDHRRVRFGYAARDGSTSRRDVEPYRLVQLGHRWYLLAYDPGRADWRSFRLDRMRVHRPEGARFTPRPAPDPASLLASTDAYFRRHRATVLVQAPVEVVAQRLPASVPVEWVDAAVCRVHASGETPYQVAVNLLLIDQDFTVEQAPAEVVAALRTLRERITAAIAGAARTDSPGETDVTGKRAEAPSQRRRPRTGQQ
jgi:predicted DNA-binding transcriptional regulator YafY